MVDLLVKEAVEASLSAEIDIQTPQNAKYSTAFRQMEESRLNKTIGGGDEAENSPQSRNVAQRGASNQVAPAVGIDEILHTDSSANSNPLKQYMTIKTARMTTQHVMSLKIAQAKPSYDTKTSRNLNIFQNEDLEHLEIESSDPNYTKRSSLVNHLQPLRQSRLTKDYSPSLQQMTTNQNVTPEPKNDPIQEVQQKQVQPSPIIQPAWEMKPVLQKEQIMQPNNLKNDYQHSEYKAFKGSKRQKKFQNTFYARESYTQLLNSSSGEANNQRKMAQFMISNGSFQVQEGVENKIQVDQNRGGSIIQTGQSQIIDKDSSFDSNKIIQTTSSAAFQPAKNSRDLQIPAQATRPLKTKELDLKSTQKLTKAQQQKNSDRFGEMNFLNNSSESELIESENDDQSENHSVYKPRQKESRKLQNLNNFQLEGNIIETN